jgi:geranylgeranyl reductase family protein
LPSPTQAIPVIIVGAGPAGCGTSFFLSKAGIQHIIIDKASFPRDKVCGDAISGKSVYVLRTASEEMLQELRMDFDNICPSPGLTFVAPNGKALAIGFGKDKAGHSPGFTATRLHFDNYLFSKLDRKFATVYEDATVLSMERNGGGWLVRIQTPQGVRQFQAKLVVGADGEKSIVRKMLGLSTASPKASAVGLRAYYRNVKGLETPEGAGNIELHFLPELLPMYLWIFPMPGGMANVGVGMPSADVRDKKINLREQMLNAIANNPALSERFKDAELEGKILGWGLPTSTTKQALSGDGYILVGDAAHLIDPFSGEGIGNALYSGMKAAQAIERAIPADDYSAANLKALYDDPLYKRLWGELKTSALLQRLSRYPFLFNFVINKANRSPTLKKTITGMFVDADLRKQFSQPGFYLKMLMNR